MNVGRNIFWSLSEQFLRIGVAFFVNMLIARTLGPQQYGIFGAAMAYAGLLGSFALFGLDLITIREISADQKIAGETIISTLYIRLASSLIILTGVIFWCIHNIQYHLATTFDSVLLVICLIIPFQALGCTINNCLTATLQSKLVTYAVSIALLVATILRIKGIHDGVSVIFFAWCYLLEFILATFLISYLFLKYSKKQFGNFRFSWSRTKDLICKARWLLLSSIVVSLLQNFGVMLMTSHSSKIDLGNYAAALRLVSVLQFMPGLVGQSFIPVISRLHDRGDSDLAKYEEQLFRLLWLIGYLLCGFFLLAGPHLVTFLLGSDFKGAIPIARILALSIIPFSLGAARAAIFSKTHSYRSILLSDFSGAMITVVLSVLLMPRYGAIGIAISTTIASSVAYLFIPLLLVGKQSASRGLMLKSAIFPFPDPRILFSGRRLS